VSVRRATPVLAAALAVAAIGAPTADAALGPRVTVMVAGKTRVHAGPVALRAPATTVRVGRRVCTIASGSPLAVLEALRRARGPAFTLRDYGRCGRRAADAGGLYVRVLGGDAARGRDGWVYKVGRRVGTTGAADVTGPFGTGSRLRSGDRLLWFWCRLGRGYGCQRTLEVVPAASRAPPGASLTVTVRGYDDFGRGVAVAGATVALGTATALTGAGGRATLVVPSTPGRRRLTAQRRGLVPAFPAEVTVG
jgi:hypothetical protein